MGQCKSWTLDFGMDSGMDYGLEYGLEYGLKICTMSRIVNVVSIIMIYTQFNSNL